MHPPGRDRRLLLSFLTACIVLLVLAALGEVGARLLVPPWKKGHPVAAPGGRRLFVHHPLLGWLPRPGFAGTTDGGAGRIRVRHNAEGFRDAERDPADSRPEWAVLGDSFVWGFNVEAEDRFVDRLARDHPGVRFANYGVSGYGTAQELLLYLYVVRAHRPAGVLLLFGGNDRSNNRKRATRAGYARPRFALRGDDLVLENFVVPRRHRFADGVPWTRSHLWDALRFRLRAVREDLFRRDPTHRLVQELANAVRRDGARFAVAIEQNDPELAAFCGRIGVPVIELGPVLARASGAEPVEFPRAQGGHWTPLGHRLAAEALSPFVASLRGPPGEAPEQGASPENARWAPAPLPHGSRAAPGETD